MIQRFSCYDCSNETQESCWQSEQFQFFAVIIIPMKYWNHFANNFFFSFRCCFVNSSELSQLLTALSSDEFTKQQQNDNKKNFSKWFQYFIGIRITTKFWNHSDYQHDSCVSLEQWKQENLWIIVLALAPKMFYYMKMACR